MASSQRCGTCNINWPALVSYNKCPKCDGFTQRRDVEDPLSSDEAQFKRKEIEFDRYYADRGPQPLTPQHASEVALTFAKADAQHTLELWLRDATGQERAVAD